MNGMPPDYSNIFANQYDYYCTNTTIPTYSNPVAIYTPPTSPVGVLNTVNTVPVYTHTYPLYQTNLTTLPNPPPQYKCCVLL